MNTTNTTQSKDKVAGHTLDDWSVAPNGTDIIQGELHIAECMQSDDPKHFNYVPRPKEAKANAKFIVRAVNSHEELLEACKNMLTYLETEEMKDLDLNKARSAIARAEGRDA